MDGDDGTSANIEALQNAISEAQAKADAGDGMFLVPSPPPHSNPKPPPSRSPSEWRR
jgi:hypothetical protein